MATSNRRDFLKNTAVAGAGLAAAGLFPRRIYSQETSVFNRLVYRDLGSTGYRVTEIGFGAMNTRDSELLHAAIDHGINYVDTAHGYQRGQNEEMIGQVLKTKRDKVFLTTKIFGNDVKKFPEMMEISLKRLQVDHVDLMLLHDKNSREKVLDEDFIRCYEDAKKKGICRFAGISTHSNQAEVIDAIVESKFWDAVLVGYNYFSPENIKPAIERARKAGIATIGMKSLLNPSTRPWSKLNDIRDNKSVKITAAQALIKWVLDDPYIDTVIPGMTSFEQLYEDLALMGMKMSFEDHKTIHRYGELIKDSYCRGVAGCTGCLNQCPKGVRINDINRCLSYANSYGDINLAWENYRNLPRSSRVDICADCDECVVKCINGLNLTENIKKARSLFA